MDKFCVFCGRKPIDKNKEHVIPLWLIKLTGDPNRQIVVGTLFGKHPVDGPKLMAFDQLTFPACSTCNAAGEILESAVRPVVLKMLEDEPVSGAELTILMDWLDKVRIGLWLGQYHYLSKNPLSSPPPFTYISRAIGACDRMLHILEASPKERGVVISGTESLAFGMQPYCFGLIINQLSFVYLSFPFCVSRALGIPYSEQLFVDVRNLINLIMRPGSGFIDNEAWAADGVSSQIIQGITLEGIQDAYPPLYDCEYTRRVLQGGRRTLPHLRLASNWTQIEDDAGAQWRPSRTISGKRFLATIAKKVLELQRYTLHAISYEKLDTAERKVAEERQRLALEQIERAVKEADWRAFVQRNGDGGN